MLGPYDIPTFRRRAKVQSTDIPDTIWRQLVGQVPFREYRFCDDRRWRFDYAWPGRANVAVEIEGGLWTRGRHVRPKGYMGDMEKYNRATESGWRVLHYAPSHVDYAQIKRMLDL